MPKLPVPIVRTLPLCAAASLLALTGCAMSRVVPASVNSAALHGNVHGGQQPVSGAVMQLWAAGTAGNASAATPLLTVPVQTSATGGFDITGDYSCPTATTQVYLTATGGDPGVGVSNGALALVVALGDCGNLPGMQSVSVNELTTAAAGWALAPFASGVDHVGASATNLTGLQNAMKVAMMMADSSTGMAPSPSMPANAQMETAKLITMADVLASCVNSDGTTPCTSLFADTVPFGFNAPVDTFQAILTIAQNPGYNPIGLYNDAPAAAPFAGALSNPPHDWTMTIAYSGGGLQNPGDVSVDAVGNVWVADRSGAISGYHPDGTPMWAQGLTGLGLSGTVSIAVDPTGNIWAANSSNNGTTNSSGSVTEITAYGQDLSAQYGFSTGVDVPVAVALGGDGRAWIANSGQSTVQVLNSDGSSATPAGGYGGGYLNGPAAIAMTAGSEAWIVNKGSGSLTLINTQGLVLKNIHCGVTPDSLALDPSGSVWVADSSLGTLLLVASNGAFGTALHGLGLSVPRSPAVDGAGTLFFINAGPSTIGSIPHGGTLGVTPNVGADAVLLNPTASALDASGDLWVTSSQDSKLVRFVGMASPVKTPLIGVPVAP